VAIQTTPLGVPTTLRSDELGNEAADEAMTRSCQRWRTVREYANPVGRAYRVGLNWALSDRRKAVREVPVAVPERGVEDSDFIPEIEAAVSEIPLEQRAVLVLRFYLDWNIDRVADALRIPEGTVKSRQRRGLDAVERRLRFSRTATGCGSTRGHRPHRGWAMPRGAW
jgi:RNA polymerase sigma factor (sigma-70 family)